jgi:hypothetical protein
MKRIDGPIEDKNMIVVGTHFLDYGSTDPAIAEVMLSPMSKNITNIWEQIFSSIVISQNIELANKYAERMRQRLIRGDGGDEVYYMVINEGGGRALLIFYV